MLWIWFFLFSIAVDLCIVLFLYILIILCDGWGGRWLTNISTLSRNKQDPHSKPKPRPKEVCELGERAVQSVQLGRVRFIDINLSRVTIVICSTRLKRAVEASKACL